jgi:hypothetical protein
VPITFAEYGIRCYGATPQNAWAVWGAVVKAIHQVGPRTKSNGLLIYRTFVLTGGQQDRDPDTSAARRDGLHPTHRLAPERGLAAAAGTPGRASGRMTEQW